MNRSLLDLKQMNGNLDFMDMLPGLSATQNEEGALSRPATGFEQDWFSPEDPLDPTGSWMFDPSLWDDSVDYLDGNEWLG